MNSRQFFWKVAAGGYEWTTGREPEYLRHRETDPSAGPAYWQTVPLRKYPHLFRKFARLDTAPPKWVVPEDWRTATPPPDPILEFAAKYGPIFHDWPPPDEKQRRHPGVPTPAESETRDRWAVEVADMREALAVWEAYRVKNDEALRTRFKWDDRREVWKHRPPTGSGSAETVHPGGTTFTGQDVQTPAAVWLLRRVNEKMRATVSTALVRITSERASERRHVFRAAPVNLLGGMWHQFAREIAGRTDYRECKAEGCEKEFVVNVTARGRGRDRQFCSRACKVRAMRSRKKLAEREPAGETPATTGKKGKPKAGNPKPTNKKGKA